MELIHSAPDTSTYISLSEHQSATPASFYNGPPVLHYHSSRAKIVIVASDLDESSPLASLAGAYNTSQKGEATTNGDSTVATADTSAASEDVDGATEDQDPVIADGQIWVTSEKLILYSPSASTGLKIPYPSISLHAIQSLPADEGQQGLYMQLITPTPEGTSEEEDEDMDSVSLTIIPSPSPIDSSAPPETITDAQNAENTPTPTEAQVLFTALSACSNLHPDPANNDEESHDNNNALADSSLFQAGLIHPGNQSGGLPPPMPGSGGWITAENMHEYFDDQGNWIGGGEDEEVEEGGEEANEAETDGATASATEQTPLGPGAGTVRPREDDDSTAAATTADIETDETDETKWRRTG